MAVIASAFILNFLLTKAIADPQGIPFSNYSYTLYGLASGNKGWTQAGYDYPNASEQDIMHLALDKIRSSPTLFLRGMLGSYRDYFTPDRGAFTFISFGSLRARANVFLWILILIGLVYSLVNWKKRTQETVVASFIGVFSSVAPAPPIDANNMRLLPLPNRSQRSGLCKGDTH